MDTSLVLIFCLILLGFTFVIFILKKEISKLSQKNEDQTLIEWLKSMQSTIENTNKTLNDTMRGSTNDVARLLQANTKQLNERLDTASKVIGDLKKNVGEMSEVGKGIRSLQDFLQSPKLRGNIGEEVLKDMIGQSFPKNSFHLQYSFKSGVKVDAVLKTDGGLLCIDSKFPMVNFKLMHTGETETERINAKKAFSADIKKHIDDISKKYILPEEHTLDFALMYIPSESVYYELINMPDLVDYARKNRVYPVSPNTLYAHLQVLLLSFQGKDLETKSKEIFQILRAIQNDYEKLEEGLGVLGKHIKNAYNSMNDVSGAFDTLGHKLSKSNSLQERNSENKQLKLE